MTAVWYISARATREYLALTGRPDDDGGPEWQRAESEIQEIARRATVTQRGHPGSGDLVAYRGPKPLRLGFVVSTTPRKEGPLPQLVSVNAGNAVARYREARPRPGNQRSVPRGNNEKPFGFNGASSEVPGTVQRPAPPEQDESEDEP